MELKAVINNEIFDILQPDIAWAGGFTETLKICSLASASGIQIIPYIVVMCS